MLKLQSDIMLFILQAFSYLLPDEEIYIYFKNASGTSQTYFFVAKRDNVFNFYPKPNFNIEIHACILKYILPPSNSINNIFIKLSTYSGEINFGGEWDFDVVEQINRIISIRLEYIDKITIHNNLYNSIFFTNKKDTEKHFKNFVKNLHKDRYNFLLETKKNLESGILQGKNILDNPYLDYDKELVKKVRDRQKRRLKFVNEALNSLEKVSYPDKKIPDTLVVKFEKQHCMVVDYIAHVRKYGIPETLIFGGCEKYGYPSRTLRYSWEDLQKIIKEIHDKMEPVKNIPNAVVIYDELVNKVKKCYYVENAPNFIVDFYKLGSCNCQCGTYMLYHLFQMYPDSALNIFVRLEHGHIKNYGITQGMGFYEMETTNVSDYFKYTDNIIDDSVECFIYSPFVLSCAYIQFDITNRQNTIYESILDLPLWEDKYNSDLETYFERLSLKGIKTLVDVDSLFILTLYNISNYNPAFTPLLESYPAKIRNHFIGDIEKIVNNEIQTEEMLYQRKRENILVFTQLKTEVTTEKARESRQIETQPVQTTTKEDLKLKLRQKIREKKKSRDKLT
jgi:hypothetical protein